MSHIYTSLVTIGGIDIYNVTADPNGVLPALLGSLAIRSDVPEVYQNMDGLTTWTLLSGRQPRVFWVNNNYPTPPGNPDGSINAPFQTIQAALDAAGPATSLVDQVLPYILFVVAGIYDEAPVVPAYRSVQFIPLGMVVLGTGGTRQPITLTLSAPKPFPGTYVSFTVTSLSPEVGTFFCDQLIVASTVAKLEVELVGFNALGIAGPAIDASGWASPQTCRIRTEQCVLQSQDTGDAGVPVLSGTATVSLNRISESNFESKAPTPANRVCVIAGDYGQISLSKFDGDITFLNNPAVSPSGSAWPQGWFECSFGNCTWTGTAAGDFQLDATSNYFFKLGGLNSVGAPSTKTILFDSVP